MQQTIITLIRQSFSPSHLRVHLCNCRSWLLVLIAFSFTAGIAIADVEQEATERQKRSWGYIDKTGKYVIPPTYDYAEPFNTGIAAVVPDTPDIKTFQDYHYKLIDKNAKFRSSEMFPNPPTISNGLVEKQKDGLWGWADAAGSFKIEPIYDDVKPFIGRYASVVLKGKVSIIDAQGTAVWREQQAPPRNGRDFFVVTLPGASFYCIRKDDFSSLEFGDWFSDGAPIAPAKNVQNETWGYIDKNGSWTVKPQFHRAGNFTEGLAVVENIDAEKVSSYSLIDETGRIKTVLPKHTVNVGPFREGLACLVVIEVNAHLPLALQQWNSKCGYINKAGVLVIPARYNNTSFEFHDGLVAVSLGDSHDERYGFIDKSGRVVIPFKFAVASGFSEGLAAVCALAPDKPAAVTPNSISHVEFDQTLRRLIRVATKLFHFTQLRLFFNLTSAETRVTLTRGSGSLEQDKRIIVALQKLALPPLPTDFTQGTGFGYLVTPQAVLAEGTIEDPELATMIQIGKLRAVITGRQEHFDWAKRQKLLEGYVELLVKLGDCDEFSSELIELYRDHQQLTKALNLNRSLYRLNPNKNRYLLIDVEEKSGNISQAESLLKELINCDRNFSSVNRTAGVVELGNFYYRHKQYALAEQQYRKPLEGINLHDVKTGLLNSKKSWLEKLDQAKGTKEQEAQLRTWHGPEADDVYRLALFFLVRNRVRESEDLFEQLLHLAKAYPETMSMEEQAISYMSVLKDKDPKAFRRLSPMVPSPRNHRNRIAIIDKQGKFIIAPKYKSVGVFNDGLAPAEVEGKFGFVDKNNNWKMWPCFSSASSFSEGLAAVSEKSDPFPWKQSIRGREKIGFIDKTGRYVIKPSVREATEFHEGLAGVRLADGYNDWGYIDKFGKVVIPPEFNIAAPFQRGVAKSFIATPDKYNDAPLGFPGYEHEVVDPRRLTVGEAADTKNKSCSFSRDLINPYLVTQDGVHKFGYKNASNAIVVAPKFDDAKCFSAEKLAAVRVGDKWGFIRPTGEFVISPKYSRAETFSNGLAIVSDTATHFIDEHGIDPFAGKFNAVQTFSQGLAPVSLDGGGTYGLIDRTGKMVLEPRYRAIRPFKEGLAAVAEKGVVDGAWGFIDTNGKIVIPMIFTSAADFQNGMCWVQLPEEQK